MSYTVDFVGMICFFKGAPGRLALLPDGTTATPKHAAKIAVDPKAVDSGNPPTGWTNKAQVKKGDFVLREPCTVHLEGVEQAGPLDTTGQDPHLPRLPHHVNSGTFAIDPATAKTVAQVPIARGVLTAFRYPGTDDDEKASIVSQLVVPHDGRIRITVTMKSGGVRTITLKAGTEVAIVNDSGDKSADHFHIFEKLASGSVTLTHTPPSPLHLAPLPTDHRIFKKPSPIVEGVRCPNTGCCS